MEGSNGNVAHTTGPRAAAASTDKDTAVVQKKRKQRNERQQRWRMKKRIKLLQDEEDGEFLPKDQIDFVVVSYKDSEARQSYVSVVPYHWLDNLTLWYPPANKSEDSRQVVNKATWRQYHVRHAYYDTLTKNRNQAQSDCAIIIRKEKAEAETSTESDVPQQRSTSKGSSVAKQPPSAPERELDFDKSKRVAPASALGKGGKRARYESSTDSEDSEHEPLRRLPTMGPPRRSPRKHHGSNIASPNAETSQVPLVSEPIHSTAKSTPVFQPLVTLPPSPSPQPTTLSPTRPIEDLPSGSALTSPAAESTPRTAMNSSMESKLDVLGQNMAEALTKIYSSIQSLTAAINDMSQRLDNRRFNTPSVSNSSVHSVDSPAMSPIGPPGLDMLTTEQRSILCRTPVVSSNDQQMELEDELKRDGRDGAFFAKLVRKLDDKTMNKSDAKKTANGVLRVLYDESYLADYVTMAGYKKCNKDEFNTSGMHYGDAGKRYIALSGSLAYWAVFEAIKVACRCETTDDQVRKAIRDGVNTLRLHDKERRKKMSRRPLNFDIDNRRDVEPPETD